MDKNKKRLLARCSPPIFRAVYRRKGARRRYSALFIAGKVLAADNPRCLSQEKVLADGQKRKTHPKMRISGVGFRLNMLRKWLSWRLDCEILHFFIIFAAEKIKPI